MKPPTPKLNPGVIYSSDNGRLICLQCAGMSAKFTGRDISGQRVTALPHSETVAWRAEFGRDLACEGGCTTYPQPSPTIQPHTTMIPAPSIPFVVGRTYTLLAISEMMAHTTKSEIVITSLLPEPVFLKTHRPSWRYGTLKLKGKRKEFHLDLTAQTLVFEGANAVLVDSDVKLSADGSTTGFSGNACFNLCGTVEEIRALITEKNLNPEFTDLDSVIAIPPGDEARTWYDKSREDLAFPDEDTNHSVIIRMRDKATAKPERSPALASAFADF